MKDIYNLYLALFCLSCSIIMFKYNLAYIGYLNLFGFIINFYNYLTIKNEVS